MYQEPNQIRMPLNMEGKYKSRIETKIKHLERQVYDSLAKANGTNYKQDKSPNNLVYRHNK